MYFWSSLLLCVVFKCQYFWSYSRKTNFWPFIYIFLYTKKLFDWSVFFYRFRKFKLSFFVLWVLSLSKNHESKMSKNWISLRPSWIFAAILDWQWVLFNTVLFTWWRSFVPICTFITKWTIDAPIDCTILLHDTYCIVNLPLKRINQ